MIHYRAVHTRTLWRKVNSHKSLDSAINGKDGAAGLFSGKARIDYSTHGIPQFVLVWEDGASEGVIITSDSEGAIKCAPIPVSEILAFEARGRAGLTELAMYFR